MRPGQPVNPAGPDSLTGIAGSLQAPGKLAAKPALTCSDGGGKHRIRTCRPGILSAVHYPNVLARDRGCTKPGCDAPAYHSQVHHVRGWTVTRRTDINDLTLACGPHNRLVEKGGFTTRKNARGDTEWLPPPHLDYGQRRPWTHH
jgi:hypothetical protein